MAALSAFVVDALDAANASVYNGVAFQGLSIGVAAEDRIICVLAGARANTGSLAVSGITIGGNAASVIKSATITDASTYSEVCELWGLLVPAGTTADIFTTFSGTMLRCAIQVYRLVGTGGVLTPFATASDTGAALETTMSAALNVPADGTCIAGAWYQSLAGAGSWTGVTEDSEQNPETTSNTLEGGHNDVVAAVTPQTNTVTTTVAFNGPSTMLSASWGPAQPAVKRMSGVQFAARNKGVW